MDKIENEDEYSPLDQWLHKQMDKYFWHAIFTVLVVAVVCSIVMTVTSTPEFENVVVVGDGDDLAYRLGNAGWVLFTTSQCTYCDTQKDILGSTVGLTVVECDSNEIDAYACAANNVSIVPTWLNVESGEVVEGMQTIEQLELMMNG